MIIEAKTPEAKAYMDELYLYSPKLSAKQCVELVKQKYGEDSIIRRQRTPQEWVEYYEFWLRENIKAGAPVLIIEDLKRKLAYWRKRCEK